MILRDETQEMRERSSLKSVSSADKLVYRLEEISGICKLDPRVIESWEKEFYFLNAGETGSGVKIFRKKDLAIILRIKELLEKEGLTLAGAKRRIEEEFGIKKSSHVSFKFFNYPFFPCWDTSSCRFFCKILYFYVCNRI